MADAPAVEVALASPLALLLEEEQRGDRQAEEALFLSFTADLGFFEAFALGVAQACGARVTVVGDAAMSAHDPRAVRRAGRSYLPGYAICTGAFHPKVVVLVGPTRATVAIGSGNVTLAGWQANCELWTVVRGDTQRCPTVLGDLAGWLRNLPDRALFSAYVPEALRRVANALDTLFAETAEQVRTEVRLVSTSTGPILDQLPLGPVDELAVCAPFHDPGAAALRALVERFRPNRLVASYQPDMTELDGPALAELSADLDAELRTDAESRYRHGKLIEWAIGAQRYALTGSPNLSGAALLRGMDRGGNCELGVITPLDFSLLPEGSPVPPETVRAVRLAARARDTGGPLPLGATRVEQGLHVLFARALPNGGHLELSRATAPPETWERVGDVPAGSREITITTDADGGSRVRLVSTTDAGIPRYSNIVFVVDPTRAVRRPGVTSARTPTTRPEELFDDPRLAERFFADLATLRSALPTTPAGASTTSSEQKNHASVSLDRDPDGWERYLDECAGRIGHSLLRFALGLPTLPGGADAAYEDLLPVSWDEQVTDDTEAGLEDDEAEALADERADEPGPATPTPPNLSHVDTRVRRHYQLWAKRLTEAAPQLGAPERMLVTRLLLWTAAAGAWERDDHAWVDLLSDALCTLAEADPPARAEPQVASLAAVALAVLRAHAPRYAYTEDTLAYDRAVNAIVHLLPATEPDYVDEYRQHIDEAFGSVVDPENVQVLAAEIVQADPVADAVRALDEIDRDAHRHGDRLLHVTGRFGNPLLAAVEAVGAAQDAAIVGAWATSTNGKWALCAWRRPDLITIDGRQARPLWRHYRLTGFLTPRALAVQKSLDDAPTVRHGPFVEPFPEALAILDQLGLARPDPPDECSD